VGSVRTLLATDLVTEATRSVMAPRLTSSAGAPRYFNAAEMATLAAAASRLIPQGHREVPVNLPAMIDARLADGLSDGWRYATMPPDGEAYRRGIAALDESSRSLFGARFVDLPAGEQDALLTAVQRGQVEGPVWAGLPPDRFFEELFVELTECYLTDPISLEEIGFAGMADARGWTRIGLDEREAWEPPEDG
jgi:hypothetical protein